VEPLICTYSPNAVFPRNPYSIPRCTVPRTRRSSGGTAQGKATPNDLANGELKPVNIYVDGAYLASLLPNASAQTLVCPGAHRISGLANRQEVALSEKNQQQINVQMASGGVHYYAAQVEAGQVIRLQSVAAETALSDMQQLPRQVHTISRTAPLQCDGRPRAASAV
jgi:hypothetical protein